MFGIIKTSTTFATVLIRQRYKIATYQIRKVEVLKGVL
jgi:hypothetical protein